jgi:hypothetical protein
VEAALNREAKPSSPSFKSKKEGEAEAVVNS